MPAPYKIDIHRDPTGLRVRLLDGNTKSIIAVLPRSFRGKTDLGKHLESLDNAIGETLANLTQRVEAAKHD